MPEILISLGCEGVFMSLHEEYTEKGLVLYVVLFMLEGAAGGRKGR